MTGPGIPAGQEHIAANESAVKAMGNDQLEAIATEFPASTHPHRDGDSGRREGYCAAPD
jgi:hypothetical protein